MASIRDICLYILRNYPHKDELSNARLTKMIYLSDWLNSIKHGKQITDIEWFYDNYGPFVWDVFNEISKNDDLFDIETTYNLYGGEKKLVILKKKEIPEVDESEIEIIDTVIEKTKSMYWNDFIKLVYSTYPILSSEKYTRLNLVDKAKEYKKQKELKGEQGASPDRNSAALHSGR